MDLSSEEEILEIEVEEEDNDEDEDDFDELSIHSLNENFYVKQAEEKNDTKQRVRERVTDRINSIFGCDISNISKVNELNAELVKKLQYLDDKHDLNSSCAPSDLHSSYWRGELHICPPQEDESQGLSLFQESRSRRTWKASAEGRRSCCCRRPL